MKQINKIYQVDINDLVFEGDTAVRMKRKYGKFKRKVTCIKAEPEDYPLTSGCAYILIALLLLCFVATVGMLLF